MRRLILVRHGETDWNSEHRIQGQQDVSLNAAGLEQAERLAARFAEMRIDALYASDLSRAYMTAQAINQHHRLPIRKDERLRELGYGKYEGLTFGEIEKRHPQEYSAWVKDHSVSTHGGETVGQLHARAKSLLDQIMMTDDEVNVLVGHGGSVKMVICAALRLPEDKYWRFRLGNTGICELELRHEVWVLESMNDQTHLYV